MRVLAYALLSFLLVPLYLLGAVFYFVPLRRTRGRVSGTAYEPFTGRVLFDLIGSRPDPLATRLAAGLPATNRAFMWSMMFPMAWASRVTGFTPNAYSYPPRSDAHVAALLSARTQDVDDALAAFVGPADGDTADEDAQVVVLGAGWDTRLYPLQQRAGLRLFEVDAPATQAMKREALARTGIDASGVDFVACDFDATPWPDALAAAGFDRTRRTFLLWEGVTMYLDAATVAATLEVFADLPAGSRLAFDVFLKPWLEGTRAGRAAQRGVRVSYGETFTWSMDVASTPEAGARELLAAHGLELVGSRFIGPPELPAYGVLEAARQD